MKPAREPASSRPKPCAFLKKPDSSNIHYKGFKYKATTWYLNGFPTMIVVTMGQQYNVGEKPTAILYTYINHHAQLLGIEYRDFKLAPVAQRYRITSDTLGREFDPGKRDFSR